MSIRGEKSWVGVGVVCACILKAAAARASTALEVLVGGESWSPRQTGEPGSLGHLAYQHAPFAQGFTRMRMQRLQTCNPTSSSQNRSTLFWAEAPVAQSAGVLRCIF